MPAPVMRDHTIALAQEEQHLPGPVVSRKRPTMAEHYGLSPAPILIENLDTVLGRNCRHGPGPLSKRTAQSASGAAPDQSLGIG